MSTTLTPEEAAALLHRATTTGALADGITGNLGAVVLAGAAGKALEDIMASDVTLVTALIDASGSIADRGLEQAIRDGHNALLDAFAGARERDAVLVACWTFNDSSHVVHSYVPVDEATRLTRANYRGRGATRLHDTWCDALSANAAYAQRLRDGGTPARSIVVVVTDGEDVGSQRSLAQCERLSRDVLASELFTLAFVGVGREVDFERVARSMGVPEGCVLVAKDATPSGLRHAFQLVSRSAVRVSAGLVQPGAPVGFFAP